MHVVDCIEDENLPALHTSHVEDEVAPETVEYKPTEQEKHIDAPSFVPYRVLLSSCDPCAAYVPALQGLHAVLPSRDEYMPAVHALHSADPAKLEYKPKPQGLQESIDRLLPALHTRHSLEFTAPIAVEYFPFSQRIHTDAPSLACHDPASHRLHAESPEAE